MFTFSCTKCGETINAEDSDKIAECPVCWQSFELVGDEDPQIAPQARSSKTRTRSSSPTASDPPKKYRLPPKSETSRSAQLAAARKKAYAPAPRDVNPKKPFTFSAQDGPSPKKKHNALKNAQLDSVPKAHRVGQKKAPTYGASGGAKTKAEFLKSLRLTTCYSHLRSVVSALLLLSIVAALITSISACWVVYDMELEPLFGYVCAILASCFWYLCVIYAIYQAVLVYIDIGDATVETAWKSSNWDT